MKVCIGVGMLSKTSNEFYVSSTINIYSCFSFTFSVVPKKVELLKIPKVMCYFENCSRLTKIVNKSFDWGCTSKPGRVYPWDSTRGILSVTCYPTSFESTKWRALRTLLVWRARVLGVLHKITCYRTWPN